MWARTKRYPVCVLTRSKSTRTRYSIVHACSIHTGELQHVQQRGAFFGLVYVSWEGVIPVYIFIYKQHYTYYQWGDQKLGTQTGYQLTLDQFAGQPGVQS